MWHMKDLGIGKIGKESPGRSLEISCGIDSGGQTRREPWVWELGYIWLVGEKAWMVRETLWSGPGEGSRSSGWVDRLDAVQKGPGRYSRTFVASGLLVLL